MSYCSHACQKRGWKRHKKVCRPPTDMATSEVCKVLIDVMRSPEIRNEPDGNVFIDPRQMKVALLCGVPRHRLGPLFRQRNHQWLKESDGASFAAGRLRDAVGRARRRISGASCNPRARRSSSAS